ncbi:Ig-like domain-containing protein, partial [Acholeplasma sp. OttesenSCG-928-E16]|nr:Ig-like domain-containing protein [Acholeplasma sp. OttesenSCG-928-E16]
ETIDLVYTVTEGKELEWSASPAGFVTVAAGKVTGVAVGEATVTAKIKDTNISASIAVKVNAPDKIPVASVTISGNTAGDVGESITLSAAVLPANATDKTVTWSSSDQTLATVANGVVSLLKAGTVTITATADGKSDTHEIVISVPVVNVASVTISGDAAGNVGDSVTLSAAVLPENATNKTVTWSSNDETLATVANGVVSLLKAGTVTITATADGKSDTHEIVISVPVSSVTISGDAAGNVGDSVTLSAAVLPENATNKTVTWSSNDETLATVANGVVTLLKAGTVTITATADGKSDTHEIVISVPVSSVTISGNSDGNVGDSVTLTAVVLPANATNKTVTWSSNDETLATVANGVVSLLKAGTVTITATADGKSDTHEIVISVPVASVTISGNAAGNVGESVTLSAAVLPENATFKTVTWSSSDKSLATVANGVVSLLKAGTVTITATADGKSDTHEIVISNVPVASVAISGDAAGDVGDLLTLSAAVLPENATFKTVTWSSNDETLATVANGVVTLLKAGTVTITATAEGKTDTHEIVISNVLVSGVSIEGKSTGMVSRTIDLVPNISPANATFKTVTWSSSDETLATVEDGVVTLLAEGTVTITVTTDDGNFTDTHEIVITELVSAYIGTNKYLSIADAYAAAVSGDTILIVEGTYNESITISKDNLSFAPYNSGQVVLTGVYTLTSGLNGVSFTGLEFTGGASIHAPGNIDNFVFKDNKVYSTTMAKSDYKPINRVDVNAFIRFFIGAGSSVVGNVTIENNSFIDMSADIITISRTSNGKVISIQNNLFKNFPNGAIRFDGGYNDGDYIIRNNEFINEDNPSLNAILFRAYSSASGKTQNIYIEDNVFKNIGTSAAYSGVVYSSQYNGNATNWYISGNLFVDTSRALYLDTNSSGVTLLNGYINYNEFRNTKTFALSDAAAKFDFNNNYFVDGDGNAITDPEEIGNLVVGTTNYDEFYSRDIDLIIGKLVGKVEKATMIVDASLTTAVVGDTIAYDGKDYVFGTNVFLSIADALAVALDNEVIYVLKGTYSDALAITQDGIKLYGPNANINIFSETRNEEAIITGTITVSGDNTTINGFKFTGSGKIVNDGVIDGLIFQYNIVDTGLAVSTNNGFLLINSASTTAISKNIIVTDSKFTYTGSAAPRYIFLANVENLYVVNNSFTSTYTYFTDPIRLGGTDLGTAGPGIHGKLYVYSNEFKDVGQCAIFINRHSKIDARIIDNNFDNIRTTAIRFRTSADTSLLSSFIYNFNSHKIETTDAADAAGYIKAGLRIEGAYAGTPVTAYYNKFSTIPFNYYFGAPAD